jgi:hypothetical protein
VQNSWRETIIVEVIMANFDDEKQISDRVKKGHMRRTHSAISGATSVQSNLKRLDHISNWRGVLLTTNKVIKLSTEVVQPAGWTATPNVSDK